MFGAPERLPAFGARTFPTVITTSVVQDLCFAGLSLGNKLLFMFFYGMDE
jgi:hypothetical protein